MNPIVDFDGMASIKLGDIVAVMPDIFMGENNPDRCVIFTPRQSFIAHLPYERAVEIWKTFSLEAL